MHQAPSHETHTLESASSRWHVKVSLGDVTDCSRANA